MTKKKETEPDKQEDANAERKTFVREVERDLDCVLTKEDLEQRASQLLQANQDRKAEISASNRLRAEAESLKSQAKALQADASEHGEEADRLLDELDDLIRATTDKIEKRPVKCKETYDYQRAKVIIVRLDTREIVEERAMKVSERQQALSFELQARQQGESGWRDKRNRLLFASDGLTSGEQWSTYYRADSGALKRFTAHGITISGSEGEAVKELKEYAEAHGFERVEGVNQGEHPVEAKDEAKNEKKEDAA